LPAGTVIATTLPPPHASCPQEVVVAARVSSTANRKPLDSQAERVSAFLPFRAAQGGHTAQVGKECGSGVKAAMTSVRAI
jgi:predicted site-specific integrase-resolvase